MILPRKQKWHASVIVVLAIVVLRGAALRLLLGGDAQERQRMLDERLRSVCERDPAPAEVRALVARRVSMSLDQWTRSLGRTDLTTRSPKDVKIKFVRSSAHCTAHCTAAFDNTAGGIVKVEAPTELDSDCQKTAAAAAPIAEAIR